MNAKLVKAIYTPREEAVEILKERQRDPSLLRKVEEYLGGNVPECFKQLTLSGTLFRHIFTPNYELEKFLEHTSAVELTPTLFEYPDDYFVALNKDKYVLAKLFFYLTTDASGQIKTYGMKVLDFDKAENVRMKHIKTLNGMTLPEFHHQMLCHHYPDLAKQVYDASDWLHHVGPTAKDYYKKFFALFITHSVLFDNFRLQDFEAMFTKDVILPALDAVRKYFGVTPLICALQDVGDENNPKWWTYPRDRQTTAERTQKHSTFYTTRDKES